jgi:hypothetical protein
MKLETGFQLGCILGILRNVLTRFDKGNSQLVADIENRL